MSLSFCTKYIQTKMEGLGYVEHSDEFDLNNIPSTLLNKSFSLQFGSMSVQRASQLDYEWTVPMSLYVFLNGYAKPSEAVDDAVIKVEEICDELFEIADRYAETGVREFAPTGLSIEKKSDDNDHILLIKLDIEAKVHIFNSKVC